MQRYIPYIAACLLMSALLITEPAHALTTMSGQQLNVPQGDASLNWAGYVAQAPGTYTSVTGTWTVPSVPASAAGTADATWVGIGGVQTHDLIQAGTQALINNDGTVAYTAWVETLPGYSQTVSLAVTSGDSITAMLTQVSQGMWDVTIKNNTSGQSYTATLNYDSSLSSAEWVEEMVSNQNGAFIPLDSFGTVPFTNASATVNGSVENLAQLNAQPLPMVTDRGAVLASVSSIGADSASFSVTRESSTPSTASPRVATRGVGFGRRSHHFGWSFVIVRL